MPVSASVTDPFDRAPTEERAALRRASQPETPRPVSATLTERCSSDRQWIFERKFDGERCLGVRDSAPTGLLSRSAQSLSDTYPEITDALHRQGCDDFVVDGKIVAFEGSRTSSARLQQPIGIRASHNARASRVAVPYYVCDVLHLAEHDLTSAVVKHAEGRYEQRGTTSRGKVCTGHDRMALEGMQARMDRRSHPFAGSPRGRAAQWIRPQLVAETGFTERTEDGKLRHPRAMGLQTDKPAQNVVREKARRNS